MRTHVTFVLDSSGSMREIEADTKGGFNTFLSEQQDEDGEATVSLYNFDSSVQRMYHGEPIENAPELTDENYTPSGRTALYDAIVNAIEETESLIAESDGDETPENVIIVVLTDGRENASETPGDTVREYVSGKREDDEWEFLFIGANQDAALQASNMGMDPDRSLDMQHSGDGARAAYQSTSESISQARQTGSTGGYDEEDRDRQRRS